MKDLMCSTDVWRFLDLGVLDPYVSEALTEAHVTARRKDLIPDTVCIRMPSRALLIGGKANINMERINVDLCKREGIPVVRTSEVESGAAILDEGIVLCYVVSTSFFDMDSLLDCMIKGLSRMGLTAYKRENSNDLLVNAKKVSGSYARKTRGVFTASCSMLIGFDYEFCESVITAPLGKAHRDWVTTLKAELGREVSYSEVVSALKKGFEEVLQVEFEVSDSLTDVEKQILEGFHVKYHSESWLRYGKWSPVKEYWRPE